MYVDLCKRLCLDAAGTDGATSEVTQPVSMEGFNAVQAEVTLFALTATNVSFQFQVTNDLENWSDLGSPQTMTAVGYNILTAVADVSSNYVRINFTITGTGKAIVAAGINVSPQ